MAGSVAVVGNIADGHGFRKSCERCGRHFMRPGGLSEKQWGARRFCSHSCAATRRRFKIHEIVTLYNSGNSSTEIGEILGTSGTHVLRLLRQAGIKTRPASENKRLSHSREWVKAKLSAAAKGRGLPESGKQKLRERIGPKNHNWNGGLTITGGYLQFTASEANGIHAGQLLHRVIGEWVNNGPIPEGYHVHHKDGNKLNNHPDNLQIMTASEHLKLHAAQQGLGKRKAS